MTFSEKISKLFSQNLGLIIVFIIAIIIFAVFSKGLLAGLLSAFSAFIGYVCINVLYHEYARISAEDTASTQSKKKTKKSLKK